MEEFTKTQRTNLFGGILGEEVRANGEGFVLVPVKHNGLLAQQLEHLQGCVRMDVREIKPLSRVEAKKQSKINSKP